MTNSQPMPTTSCKFCGVPHMPGHDGCDYFPNFGTEDYRIKHGAKKVEKAK